MFYKGLILCLAYMCISLAAISQEAGVVEVNRDTLISLLQSFRADNEINPTVSRTISLENKRIDKSKATRVRKKGFRVQIYSGPNRSDAYAAQSRFKHQYSDMESYINYDEPNYRVKAGDFTSRSEANSFMRILRSQYSNVFVFQEDIWVWE